MRAIKSGVTTLSFATDVLAETDVMTTKVVSVGQDGTFVELVVLVAANARGLNGSNGASLNGVNGGGVEVTDGTGWGVRWNLEGIHGGGEAVVGKFGRWIWRRRLKVEALEDAVNSNRLRRGTGKRSAGQRTAGAGRGTGT